MASPPEIPIRQSSKRVASNELIEEYRQRENRINTDLDHARKSLKPSGSFDATYWKGRVKVSKLLQERNTMKRKISVARFRDSNPEAEEEEWAKSSEGRNFQEKMKSHMIEHDICLRQADRTKLEAEDPHFDTKRARRVFMTLFTTSSKGLGIDKSKTGGPDRNGNIQNQFQKELIRVSQSKHPSSDNKSRWCPILGSYVPKGAMIGAHIFAYFHGSDLMSEIFGADAGKELNTPYNGLYIFGEAEKRFDKGQFVIVPDIKDARSLAEVTLWNVSQPKSYKIRIIDHQAKGMGDLTNGEGSLRWRELEGKSVEFKSDFRPRARYLYFHYCVTMLRRSWNLEKKSEVLRDELGRLFWATPGRYIREKMLLALVEEMGHEYEELLSGAFREEDEVQRPEEKDDTLLNAATQQIQFSNGGADETSNIVANVGDDTEESGSED
ncbi:MAG: hypothetical protein Q9170_002450 [Blastenia crenularia]